MRSFDLMVPYTLYSEGDPILLYDVVGGFADYILERYREKIDEYLNKAGRYSQYKKVYGKYLSEYAESKGYPKDLDFSGSLIVDSMIKKDMHDGILLTISSLKRPKGSKIPIDQYVRMVEYGSAKFPALNVLRRANRDIRSNMRRYYEEYRRETT